jgi:hypothetical protein
VRHGCSRRVAAPRHHAALRSGSIIAVTTVATVTTDVAAVLFFTVMASAETVDYEFLEHEFLEL